MIGGVVRREWLRRRWARRGCVLLLVLIASLVCGTAQAPAASAHPLGNFTVNSYDGITLSPALLRSDHVEDLAEIPAAQVKARSGAELAAWARGTCARAAHRARVHADGRVLPVTSTNGRAAAQRRPGQAGLATLRLECELTAHLPSTPSALRITTGMGAGEPAGPGWREITARGDRVRLGPTAPPAHSASARLTHYPDGLLSTPRRQHTAAFSVRPGGPALSPDARAGAGGGTEQGNPAGVLGRGADGLTQKFTGLIGGHRLSLGFALLALAGAAVLGAGHALAPGHGKTVMAAYAATRTRNSLRAVLRIGAAVTVTHTAGVLVLGALVLGGSQITPVALPWLTVLSGVVVAVAGGLLLRRALRTRHPHHHGHHHHGHGEGHGHRHDHGHGHGRQHGTRDGLLLGFAGGLVPSPSAVVVLVGSSALGQLWFGFLLVTAYGAGLAFTLVVVAVLLGRVGKRLAGAMPRHERVFGVLHRRGPAATAALVVLLGAYLAIQGVARLP